MLRGLYSVAGAMERASRNQEIISENLVNSTTPGYRRQGMVFDASPTFAEPDSPAVVLPRGANSFVYLETGSLQKTDNPLDVAVSGDAFFAVQGPNGPLYTRNGTFQLSPTGQLQTRSGGYPVLGQGSALNIPIGTTTISIASDGTVSADGTTIGQLQFASFTSSDSLQRVGPTLFEGSNPQTPLPGSVQVQQGFRESSNVQPVQEMVSMMMGMRTYEAAQKVLQTMTDAIAQNTRPQQS